MSSSSRPGLAAIVVVAWLAIPNAARADKAAADVAFAEAKRLMGQGKIAEACPKFELSHHEDPQLGTLLNLADCHEQLGRLATAWAEFREAMELARNRGDDREAFARERSEKLAPRISQLVLVKRGDAPGLRVQLDGRDVTALVGVAIPVDPGSHAVTTTSDADAETTKTIEIGVKTRKLELPVPFASAEVAAPPDTHSDRAPAGRTGRWVGIGLAATGVIVSGVGAYFAKRASDQWDESRAFCDEENRCDERGGQLIDDASSSAMRANVLIGLGVGLLAAGAIVYLTAPKEQRASVTARPIVAPSVVGGALTVQF